MMLPLGALLIMNLSIYKGLQRLHRAPPVMNEGHKMTNGLNTTTDGSSELVKLNEQVALNTTENEEERERDARFTRASVLMVLAFGLCHTPRLITNTLEMVFGNYHPYVRKNKSLKSYQVYIYQVIHSIKSIR